MLGSFSASLSGILEWSVAQRPIEGERQSGDLHTVVPTTTGMLVGVVDGLGHGKQAAIAARAAIETLELRADLPLAALIQYCHEELHHTRGAALSLASFHTDDNSMSWLGVGNVAGILFRAHETGATAREALLTRGGVVGYRLPPPYVKTLTLRPGDTLIFATDGIHSDFSRERPADDSPKGAADDILARYGKMTDDALVLVARYAGIRL
jgi:serine phosphatase RsbU (regulator of sigma subunit)